MQPFVQDKLDMPPVKDFIKETMEDFGISREAAKREYNRLKSQEIWVNELYQVNIDKDTDLSDMPFPVWHLSIKRRDKQPIHDWRDLQAIKNMLAGEEVEAVEVYPAESRLMDGANQYHLWAFPEGQSLALGWRQRYVDYTGKGGAVQRSKDG